MIYGNRKPCYRTLQRKLTIVFNRPYKDNQSLKICQSWCPKLDNICALCGCRQLLYSSSSCARNQERAVSAQHDCALGCLMHEVLPGNIPISFLNLSNMSFLPVILYRVICQYQVFERPLKPYIFHYYPIEYKLSGLYNKPGKDQQADKLQKGHFRDLLGSCKNLQLQLLRVLEERDEAEALLLTLPLLSEAAF